MNPYLLVNLKQIYYPIVNNRQSAYYTISKIPYKLRVICVLEALKMILHIWEKSVFNSKQFTHLTKEQKEAPRRFIETVREWLDGKATADEVKIASDYAHAIALANSHIGPNRKRRTGTVYVIYTAYYLIKNNDPEEAYSIISEADVIYDSTDVGLVDSSSKFITKWWDRCYPLIQKELQHEYDILGE